MVAGRAGRAVGIDDTCIMATDPYNLA
jgi:hypothetical protein